MTELGATGATVFRLPSGALVKQRAWFTASSGGPSHEELAYVIGARLRALLSADELASTQVVWWEGVREELADAVQSVIGSQYRPLPLTSADLGFHFGSFAPIEPRRRVAVVTDAILTGRTASSILRTLRRMEGIPVAVATVIDGRSDFGAPVVSFDGPVPVIACLSATLVVPEDLVADTRVRDIDARGRMLPSPPARQDAGISPATFLSWLRTDEHSGVYVGHINRGRSRHFSTYLNIGALVAEHPEASEAIVENALKAFSMLPSGDTICVVSPDTEGGYASALRSSVARSLRDRTSYRVEEFSVQPRPEGGWDAGGRLWPLAFVALIVDWGAVTTATVQALMTLAGENGAIRVHASVLTSQLEPSVEERISTIAAIRVQQIRLDPSEAQAELSSSPEFVEVEIPASATFLARVPMGMASGAECHLCALAQLMRVQAIDAPSRLLRDHAAKKYDLYRPRARREVFGVAAADLVGSPLGADASAAIWDRHQALEEARTSPERRAELRSRIMGWDPIPELDDLAAWICLLTVEPYWLDRAPLDSEDVRARIGHACAEVVVGGSTPTVSNGLRWQAAIVLRIASKRIFTDRFGELIESAVEAEDIAAELCQGMYTLLLRPYNHRPFVMAKVLATLLDTRDRLVYKGSQDGFSRELLFTVTALYRKAVSIRAEVSGSDDVVAAWHGLQSDYAFAMQTHAGALTGMLVVLNAVSGPAAEQAAAAAGEYARSRAYWVTVSDAWGVCWGFLAQTAFPYFTVLRDLLEGAVPAFASRATGSLAEFTPERAAKLGGRFADLERDPTLFEPETQESLEREVFAWFEALLRAPEGRAIGGHFQGSQLSQLLDDNPCSLAAAWEAARERAAAAGLRLTDVLGEIDPDIEVFCRRSLLVDTFGQIIENAAGEDHAAARDSRAGVVAGLSVQLRESTVHLTVRNTGTVVGAPREGGLAFFSSELAAFGAKLAHRPADTDGPGSADSPWTYEVSLSLARWPWENT